MKRYQMAMAIAASVSLLLVGVTVAFADAPPPDSVTVQPAHSSSTVPTLSKADALAALNNAQSNLDKAQTDLDKVKAYLNQTTSKPTKPPKPTTPAPTPSPTVPPVQPPADGGGTSAASARGWVEQTGGDEFNSSAVDQARWSMYNGPGHDGNGRRTPTAFSVNAGVLQVHGDANGNSGGMAYKGGQKYGKWEARMKIGAGDRDYHPVLLMWPDSGSNSPQEIDYAEMNSTAKEVDFFLHDPRGGQTHASVPVDVTLWHNYAMEWNAQCIKGYVDNKEFFSDCNKGNLPTGSMHMTIQLDAFSGSSGYTPTDMYVDWIRQYK